MYPKFVGINSFQVENIFSIYYIYISSQTEAGSAGEQLVRDSWMVVINDYLVGSMIFPLYLSSFIIIKCLKKRTLINQAIIPFHAEPKQN